MQLLVFLNTCGSENSHTDNMSAAHLPVPVYCKQVLSNIYVFVINNARIHK